MSSATDVKEKGGAGGGKGAEKSTRPNPVALEVPVSVTWAKPARANEKRDLYTEETVTVLVFRDGAVIQLSAAITIGQLLFLTHKKSKREVVCQVVQKRSFRPTSCFVELEFTEEAENFWGVSFPAADEGTRVPPMAEAVAAEETAEDDHGASVEAPKSEDVAQLKDEVKALRTQLQELRDQKASEEKHAEEEKKPAEDDREAVVRRLAETEAAARRAAEEEAKNKAEQAPAQTITTKTAPVRPQIAMRLPSLGGSQATAVPTETSKAPPAANAGPGATQTEDIDPMEDLLPKPALDFSRAKVVDPNDPFNIYRPARKGLGKQEKMAAGGLLALVIVGGGVAWYMNRLPFLHRTPKVSAAAKSAPTAMPATPAPAVVAPNMIGGIPANAAPSPAAASAPASTNAETVNAAPARANSTPVTPGKPAANFTDAPPREVAAEHKPATTEKNSSGGKFVAARISKNRGKAVTSAESKPQPVPEAVASDAPVVPAKLLRSVSPVYPPDAMRNYITGDVRIEAQVDAKGHVGAMNVLLGPSAFREPAMDALRQYEYAPATQGGKPVASKVVVTVKFWFDP